MDIAIGDLRSHPLSLLDSRYEDCAQFSPVTSYRGDVYRVDVKQSS